VALVGLGCWTSPCQWLQAGRRRRSGRRADAGRVHARSVQALLRATPSISYTDPKSWWRVRPVLRPRARSRSDGRTKWRAKRCWLPGSHRVVVAVAKGEAAVGITFKRAIVTTAGLKFAGPPAASSGGPRAVHRRGAEECQRPDIAQAFVASLTAPEAAAVWTELGFVTGPGVALMGASPILIFVRPRPSMPRLANRR
jgi:hypothetical protein